MTTLFTNLNLFDGKHNKTFNNVWMLVKDGKITKVSDKAQPKVKNTKDLHGKYVMPGLINCHTHVFLNPQAPDGGVHDGIVETTVRSVKHLHQLLKSGVTYVRGCGSTFGLDLPLAKMQREGKLHKVPRMMPAGRPMAMTGGHGQFKNGSYGVDSPDEMRKAVRTNFMNGAKCTKVMATGGVMSENDNMNQPQLKVPEMKVAVEETHSKHTIVAAHAEGNPGIMNAIKAGVDSIEHGFYVNNKEIKMMLKQGTYLTPTLVSAWSIVHYGSKLLPKWMLHKLTTTISDLYANIHNAYEQGVKITLGTDAGTPFNYFWMTTPKELELLTKKEGMSNFDALSTSRHSAELMKLKDYGTLEPGKYADFLVLAKNPLTDVKAVQQKDKAVYQHGARQY